MDSTQNFFDRDNTTVVGQPWSCLRSTAAINTRSQEADLPECRRHSSSTNTTMFSRPEPAPLSRDKSDADSQAPTFSPHSDMPIEDYDNIFFYDQNFVQSLQDYVSDLPSDVPPFPQNPSPDSYNYMYDSPSPRSLPSTQRTSPFPGQRDSDSFPPNPASPEPCYDQCSGAQECSDRHCDEAAEYGLVPCTEPSCTLENSLCGGDMPAVAVDAATYLQSAPNHTSIDWQLQNNGMPIEFNPMSSFEFDWLPSDTVPMSSMPGPPGMGPFLDGGDQVIDHQAKRRRRDLNLQDQMAFPAQPMMDENINFGFDSSSAICKWNTCDQVFANPLARDQHVHEDHFHSQITVPCSQDDCGDVSGMDMPSHLKRKHGLMMGEEECYFQDCSYDPNDGYLGLEQHVDQKHSSPLGNGLNCQWEDCHGNFDKPVELANHLEIHEVYIYNSHVCQWKDEGSHNVCGQRFQSPKELQEHTKTAHLASLSKKVGYICRWDGCERASKADKTKLAFAQRGKLERHMQSHTKYKACTCHLCHKDFSAEQALEQHMRTHDGRKPFECKEPGCGKCFAQASALTMHKRTHTGEKPLKCPECGKQFAESSNLSKHRKTHNKVGEHACEEPNCGKTFHRPEQLKKHREKHAKQLLGI